MRVQWVFFCLGDLLFHFEGELGTANVNGVKYLKLTNGVDSQVYIKHFEYIPEREENTKNLMSGNNFNKYFVISDSSFINKHNVMLYVTDEQEAIFNRNLAKIHPSMEKALATLGFHVVHFVVNTFLFNLFQKMRYFCLDLIV